MFMDGKSPKESTANSANGIEGLRACQGRSSQSQWLRKCGSAVSGFLKRIERILPHSIRSIRSGNSLTASLGELLSVFNRLLLASTTAAQRPRHQAHGFIIAWRGAARRMRKFVDGICPAFTRTRIFQFHSPAHLPICGDGCLPILRLTSP